MLGVLAVDLDVAELGVGHEHAVVEHPAADAGAERDHDDDALAVPAGAEADLGEPGGVGVVEHEHRRAEPIGEDLVSASVPIHCLSTLAAVKVAPFFTTAGNVQPTGPCQSKWSTTSATTSATAFGVAGFGVRMRKRSPSSCRRRRRRVRP